MRLQASCPPGLRLSEGATGAEGFICKLTHRACCQASRFTYQLTHLGLSTELPSGKAAGLPRAIDLRDRVSETETTILLQHSLRSKVPSLL